VKRITIAVLISFLFLVSVGQAQRGGKTQVYDNFSSHWLDPVKWQAITPQCGNSLECVREIRSGKLRLAVRNFGNTDSDDSTQWGESEVYFPDPNAVLSITAEMTVRSFSGVGCSTNATDRTHTEVKMGGNFFNTGSGDVADDVTSLLIAWVDTLNPQVMNVGGWWGWRDQGGWTNIESFPIGTPLTASIKWDKANHQFIAEARDKNGRGGQVTMPYTMSDSTPPVNAGKILSATVNSLNCTSGKTNAQVEATYDHVIINH
jgi:hypothetical protein